MKHVLLALFLCAFCTAGISQTVIIETFLDQSAGISKPKQWKMKIQIHDETDGAELIGEYKSGDMAEAAAMMTKLVSTLNRYYHRGYKLVSTTPSLYVLQKE